MIGFVLDAELYSGGDFDNMKKFRDGRMVIDIRAKTGASKKNRGTAFRTKSEYMPELFNGVDTE